MDTMKKKLAIKWMVIILWIVASVILIRSMPNLAELTLEKGQPNIPDNYSVKVAQEYEKEFNNYDKNSTVSNLMLVFYSDKALSDSQKDAIKAGIDKLKVNQDKIKIFKMTTPFDSQDAASRMISKDDTTLIVSISLDKTGKTLDDIKSILDSELNNVTVKHYITGQDYINDANVKTSQAGVHKTELFTGIIIFIVLVLVFRSPITPIISLFTILLTYIASLSVVAQFVDKLNFPYSTMTQSFLLLVIFGIGTDYNILLLSRFKEELIDNTVEIAIKNTFKTAGKTVCFSAGTVLIGFGVLVLAKFSVFRAASAVAIAVVILLLELYTLLPAFMYLLGKKIFLFNSKKIEHKDSKLWGSLSKFSKAKPIISIVISLLITVPFALIYKGDVSYDMLKDSDSSFDAVKGINLVSDKFGMGTAFPVTIYLKDLKAMDNGEVLQTIDQLTDNLKKLPGVDKVYSVTRPKGEKIDGLYVDNQTNKATDGLSKANEGLSNIIKGLSDAQDQMKKGTDLSNVDQLMKGSTKIASSMDELNNGLAKVKEGIDQGAEGSAALSKGITELKTSMSKLTESTSQVSDNYTKLYQGLTKLQSSYEKVTTQAQGLKTGFAAMNQYIVALGQSQPQNTKEQSYVALKTTIETMSSKLDELLGALNSANDNFKVALNTFKQVNDGMAKIVDGQAQIENGVDNIQKGANSLTAGLKSGSAGQKTIIESNKKLTEAMDQVLAGQKTLSSGLTNLSNNMSNLNNGLLASVDGLNKVSRGIDSAGDYFNRFSNDKSSNIFYIPEDQIKGNDFKQSIVNYLSSDYKITKMVVYLNVDPYSKSGIDTVSSIEDGIKAGINTTNLATCSIGIAGTSSMTRDLQTVSSGDLRRAEIIMIIGIAVILLMISKSFKMTLAIIASLLLTDYAAISVTNLIFAHVLGAGNLSWSVPFFSFIMIIALGVDYSIFLLMRLQEESKVDSDSAIVNAASKVGGIVISAMIILSGTFAALYPANVATLTELATTVIIGLLLLVFVLLPIFVPAIITFKLRIKNHR
jgi:RND superfamily putative drug exporter